MSDNKITVTQQQIKSVIRQRKLDNILNKTVLDLTIYSAFGYAFGIGASVLFKNKSTIRNIAAGVGGSYAYVLNMNNFNKLV